MTVSRMLPAREGLAGVAVSGATSEAMEKILLKRPPDANGTADQHRPLSQPDRWKNSSPAVGPSGASEPAIRAFLPRGVTCPAPRRYWKYHVAEPTCPHRSVQTATAQRILTMYEPADAEP